MKKKPTLDKNQFDEQFIAAASTAAADEASATPADSRPIPAAAPTVKPKAKGRLAADGRFRTTFDLSTDLYELLRERSFRSREPMRDIVENALRAHLAS